MIPYVPTYGQEIDETPSYYGEVFYNVFNNWLIITNAPYTIVVRVKASGLLQLPTLSQNKAIVTARGSLKNMYIGHNSEIGNAWSFAETPVAVTFEGNTTISKTYDLTTNSDPINFEWNGVSDILIAFELLNSYQYGSINGIATKSDVYQKANIAEAALVSKSSAYVTVAGYCYSVEKLQLNGFEA